METLEYVYTACMDAGLAFILLLIILLIHLIIKIHALMDKEEELYNLEKKKLEESSKEKIIKDKEILEYSELLLKSIREAIASVTTVKYRTFSDNHDLEKITKEHLKRMLGDTVTIVKNDINFNNIDYENLIYTKEYINQYIIDTTIYTLKNMFNGEIDGI
jgi:biopolymer transport protein ExbB/TolQ